MTALSVIILLGVLFTYTWQLCALPHALNICHCRGGDIHRYWCRGPLTDTARAFIVCGITRQVLFTLYGDMKLWRLIFTSFATGIFCMLAWELIKNEDDDRWRRRRERVTGWVRERNGRLIVVPE